MISTDMTSTDMTSTSTASTSTASTSTSNAGALTALDHVGIVVPDLDEAVAFYLSAFGARLVHREQVGAAAKGEDSLIDLIKKALQRAPREAKISVGQINRVLIANRAGSLAGEVVAGTTDLYTATDDWLGCGAAVVPHLIRRECS